VLRRIICDLPVVVFTSALFGAACRPVAENAQYRAEIRRTDHRVAHIVAADFGSLGFGEGFAAAEDHLCSIADQVVRVRGERARYFGRGDRDSHLLSDVAFKALDIRADADAGLASQPQEIRDWLAGFAAGYNRYLRETGTDSVPGWCRGESWVFAIEPADIHAYLRSIVLPLAGIMARMAPAAPPAAGGEPTASDEPVPAEARAAPEAWEGFRPAGASNGWAIGRDRSESGGGMLVANPHYPWVGSNRMWEKHLTIPGELDVYGVSLIGLPGVAVGFNRNVAWTHTVSAGERLTLYKLDLVPGSPTTYRYDGEERQMTPRSVSVEVLEPDGALSIVEQVVWFSHYGPVVNLPGMQWTESTAFAIRDANEANHRLLAQWLDMARATTMDAFQEAHRRWNAAPWVNTIATSRDGRAWYADGSATPNLSQEALELWETATRDDEPTKVAWSRGMVLLDGSDSRFEWQNDPDARAPGIVSFARSPQLERTDYVFNANDSYWMPNSTVLLTGYSQMHGTERSPRNLRPRMNARMLGDTSPEGPSGADGRFSLEELAANILSNRSEAAELLLDELVARCRGEGQTLLDGEPIDLSPACDVLAGYNGRLDLDSSGAVLFREWITQYRAVDQREAGVLFARPFDSSDPVGTPSGLAEGPLALENLGRAVRILEQAGLGLDAPLRDTQLAFRGGRAIPIHGGNPAEGVANVVNYDRNLTTLEPGLEFERIPRSRALTTRGYPINRGTSFLLAIEFTAAGPRAEAFLTYSQSGDPDSPYFSDQTELFSRKAWRAVLFDEAEIAAATRSTVTVTGF
jgi:acyl-homoserine-lactone acylase